MRFPGPAAASASDGASLGHDESQVPVLEPALWKQLNDAADFKTFCDTWLALQSGLIGNVAGGVVVAGQDLAGIPLAVRPANWSPASLASVAKLAFEQQRGVEAAIAPSRSRG